MVPKEQGGGQGKKQGKGSRQRPKPAVEPPVMIDPDLAVMARVPLRTTIVATGHQHLMSPVEIAETYDLDVKYVSNQFKVLRNAGLIELIKKVKVRGVVQHMYRSTKRAFVTTGDWSQFGTKIQEGMSGAAIQDLNGEVARSIEAKTFDSRDDRYLYWECGLADEISWANSAKIVDLTISALKRESAAAADRHAKGESDAVFPATFAVLSFESPTESALKKAREQEEGEPSSAPKRRPPKGREARRRKK